jgi:hypothetical protein
VVIADVALRDAFGRTVHTSAVEFTQSSTFDAVVGVAVEPSPLLLSEGFGQRVPLRVTGSFALAGQVDLSGPHRGVQYRSLDEGVAAVTTDGQVVARGNGETRIEISYAGYTATAHVVVDSTAVVERLEVLPASAVIERVGGSLRLGLEGVLSDGRRVDVSSRALGTTWHSLDPGVLTVNADGRAVGLRPGTARVEARHAGYSALRIVEVRDGPPEISLLAPAQVVAGTELELRAQAQDDVALASVEFLVNGVVTSRLTAPPFTLKLRAPPVAGGEMVLGAVAVDTNGSRTRATELTLKVQPEQGASTMPIVYESPLPGALLLEELPQTVTLTSGNWRTHALSTQDFQLVRFYADGALIGTSRSPRVEVRNREVDVSKPPELVAVCRGGGCPRRHRPGALGARADRAGWGAAGVPAQPLGLAGAGHRGPAPGAQGADRGRRHHPGRARLAARGWRPGEQHPAGGSGAGWHPGRLRELLARVDAAHLQHQPAGEAPGAGPGCGGP